MIELAAKYAEKATTMHKSYKNDVILKTFSSQFSKKATTLHNSHKDDVILKTSTWS